MTYGLVWSLVACLWLMPVGLASAQESNPQARFNQAVELATAGDYAEAVEVCLEVLELLPEAEQLRVQKLLGYAYKKLDMQPEAWHHLTRYFESAGQEDTTTAGWLQDVEDALEQTHVKISLSCEPDNTLVYLPASLSSSGPVPRICPAVWWFLPGKRHIQAEATGYMPRIIHLDVLERGDSGGREVRLVPQVRPATRSRSLEWTLIGSGLALGVTGGILHGIGYSKNEDLHTKYRDLPNAEEAKAAYDDAYAEEVRPKEISAYVLYGVGGAALVAGVVIWALRKSGDTTDGGSHVRISPMMMPGGTGALMTFGF